MIQDASRCHCGVACVYHGFEYNNFDHDQIERQLCYTFQSVENHTINCHFTGHVSYPKKRSISILIYLSCLLQNVSDDHMIPPSNTFHCPAQVILVCVHVGVCVQSVTAIIRPMLHVFVPRANTCV